MEQQLQVLKDAFAGLYAIPRVHQLYINSFMLNAKKDWATLNPSNIPKGVAQARKGCEELRLNDSVRFYSVDSDYYSWSLEKRAITLSAPSIDHLCKSLIFENTRHSPTGDLLDPLNSKYYLVIVQYVSKLNTQKLMNFIRDLSAKQVSKKNYNLRVAPEAKSVELSGYVNNAVTPFGMNTNLPIILSESITKLNTCATMNELSHNFARMLINEIFTDVRNSNAANLFVLPHELLTMIFLHFAEDQRMLYSLSNVCRDFNICVTPILYRFPKFTATFEWAQFVQTLIRPKNSRNFGLFVQMIDLSSPDPKTVTDTNSLQVVPIWSSTCVTKSTIGLKVIRRAVGSDDVDDAAGNNTALASVHSALNMLLFSLPAPQILTPRPTPILSTTTTTQPPRIKISASSLLQLAQFCPKLLILNLANCTILPDTFIYETGEYLSSMQQAPQPYWTTKQVKGVESFMKVLEMCDGLVMIDLKGCEWVTDEVVKSVVKTCRELRALNLTRCGKVTSRLAKLYFDPECGGVRRRVVEDL